MLFGLCSDNCPKYTYNSIEKDLIYPSVTSGLGTSLDTVTFLYCKTKYKADRTAKKGYSLLVSVSTNKITLFSCPISLAFGLTIYYSIC